MGNKTSSNSLAEVRGQRAGNSMANKFGFSSLPEGTVQINRSLYLLPSLSSKLQAPECDVVCFHGLQPSDNMYKDAFWLTWSSDDGDRENPSWLNSLVAQSFHQARIMSVSYDYFAQVTFKVGGSNSQNIYEKLQIVGEKLLEDLVLDQNVALGVGRPLILIGHSLGGILLKLLIMHADFRKTQLQSGSKNDVQSAKIVTGFLKNLAGVVYFSTPHDGGFQLVEFASKLHGESPVLQFLQVCAKETLSINENFKKWLLIIPSFSFYEYGRTTYEKVWNDVVVSRDSLGVHGKGGTFGVEDDHFGICKISAKKYRRIVIAMAKGGSFMDNFQQFTTQCLEEWEGDQESSENRERGQTAGMGGQGHTDTRHD